MITPFDLDIAAKTVWGEARGEGELGMQAVANVIINRWRKPGWWSRNKDDIPDDTIAAVCKDPWQFSCWNLKDPNRAQMDGLTLDDKTYRVAMRLVLNAIDMLPDMDITRGATYYHTVSIKPNWAEGKTPCATVYRHKFYRDIK